ncbi:MAG: 30S ribosomal protein S19e [Pyrobaculum sp.]
MTSIKEVPPGVFIVELAKYIKNNAPQVKPPVWAPFVKTGPNKERPPADPEWWYIRAASLMRKLYIHGAAGVGSLRTAYGYRAKVGDKTRRERTRKAGGAAIRKLLQQLEQAGFVTKTKAGRVLTPEGRSLMDRIAAKIAKDLAKDRPELLKYISPKE